MLPLTFVFLSVLPLFFSEASSVSSRMRLRRAGSKAKNNTGSAAVPQNGQWNFFDQKDPTHGLVKYLDVDTAKSDNLAFVLGNSMVLRVRISSKVTYNAGSLFIADFAAMPASCGAWPAWWTVGPSWPNGGEIDVLEGVYQVNTNKMTLHTSEGCIVNLSQKMTTGKEDSTSCASSNGDNQGCGVSDADPATYGAGFNQAGGGVYAHSWTNDAIAIWHFARKDVPADITSNEPDPTKWGTPAGLFSAGSGCDFSEHFHDHVLTIDTTLCGDWAGGKGTMTHETCPSIIPQGTTMTCADVVRNPQNFDDARWNINSIEVYQLQ
ncbi:concanavalin A-like lectin/glucanase domain-containing protein [Mycena alexandri]|uniref:Concanavalin A-like lectin/glucanase domain-containing protein n=1 Tax=Mycena alexandri TaxID=1745969 RepID=A0AAD6TCS1_9AGAR|nr:concanavalin A-like lectin/glucanase domain-containing protein [Mycena alexandri]